ncbi:flavodoxin family protein [Lysobacter sp. D1-1-M9]|uniref:flavodoxin family protein n=1 Tax=Novilysobacter longmucuonensis TaxID=3098603 RepID=UPI002FCA35EB
MLDLSAYGLNCTLKGGPAESSTQKMLDQVLQAIAGHGARTASDRAVDHDIKPGVRSDEGAGDAWPMLRQRVLASDIFVLATPIWLGQPSSVCKRVLERMDAFLGETDDRSRYPSYGRVAAVCVVGNEDGAHHVCAELYQALADVGFTIPAAGAVYWVGEAMHSTDFKDLDKTPDKVASTIKMLASNATHLAGLLKQQTYPGVG